MSYRVEFSKRAAKQFRALDQVVQRRLTPKFDALALNPHMPGSQKLSGEESIYRIRVGDYRILYEIQSHKLIVLVVEVGTSTGSLLCAQLARA